MDHPNRADLAKAAYIYGYALVYDITEVISQTTAPKVPYVGPVNLFGHATRLADFSDAFVSLNNDTLYSFAHCDVSKEPLVFHVPDTNDRYYVMQFVDPWTNNFAYVGRRSSGTGEGTFILTGPDWQDDIPTGMQQIPVPNNVFSIIGRYAVDGEADIPNVAVLQQQTWLTPLSRYPVLPDTANRAFGDWDIAPYNTAVTGDLEWWEKFRAWMQLFPPPPADQPFLDSIAGLGLFGGSDTYLNPDPALAADLIAGASAGQELIEDLSHRGSGITDTGWVLALHSFDYNLNRLGPGTIDSDEWKIADLKLSWAHRAAAARGGLWGNHGYEASYGLIFIDEDKQQLNGANRYVIHFDQPPPVKAFWSVTMYGVPTYYLVENEIGRYSIGDRTPGLQYNANGSLDIYLQHDAPTATSNWLPTPTGDFRPIMRMYQPEDSILDGTYKLPPIRKITG